MKFNKLIIVYLIMLSFNGYSQQHKDKYNFDFEKPLSGSSWICIMDDFRGASDSTNKINGKRSLLLTRGFLRTEFNLNLYQTILLPKTVKNIKASISAENDLLFSAELKLTGLDKNRNLISTDSISIINNKGWQKFVTTINSKKGIDILIIEIKAKEPFKEKKRMVKLWLDNLQIIIDGIDLYDYKDIKYPLSEAERADIRKNVKLSPLLEIPEKDIETINSKIIGFGETVHGSKEMTKSAFNNIKQLIINHNCRLVILETTIDLGIRLNQFVQQDIFDEDLKELIMFNHIDNEEFYSFINWIKQYNLRTNNKVTICGIDFVPLWLPRQINNFLLSKKLNSKAIDSLVVMINSGNYRSITLKFAEKHADQFKPILGEGNYLSMVQYLKNRTDTLCRIMPLFQSYDWGAVYKDFLLWQNTKFAIDNFSDKTSTVAIYTHLSHLNKKTPIWLNSVKSLGQYMTDYYKTDFYLIGMFVGEGTISTLNLSRKVISQKIDPPAPRSIEYICSLAKGDHFYKTLPLLSTVPVLYRDIGALYSSNREFIPSFPKGSMDAIIYFSQCTEGVNFPFNNSKGYEVHDLYRKANQ